MVANRRKLFFVLILAMSLCGCSLSKKENKEELNLLDYVKAEYMGTQGNLKVSLQMDEDKVRETYQTLKEEKSTLDAIVFYEFMDSVTLEYDKRADTYRDGDKIKVEFGWNESLSEECPFRALGEGDFEVAVEEELEEVNPFDGLDVYFSGMEESMWVDFFPDECDEAVKEYGLFYMDEEGPAYNKKNGDRITVHFMWEDYEAAGKIAVKDTQEYTVEGLGKYVTKANQEALEYYTDKMLAKAQKDVMHWTDEDWEDTGLIENQTGIYTYDAKVSPYKNYYIYMQDEIWNNSYVGIYKIEAWATVEETGESRDLKKGDRIEKTMYYLMFSEPIYENATGEVMIDEYFDVNDEAIFTMDGLSLKDEIIDQEGQEDICQIIQQRYEKLMMLSENEKIVIQEVK